MTTTQPRPALEGERLSIVDACRGFALGGIYLLNLGVFTGFVFMSPDDMARLPTAALDRPVALLTVWLGYGKFYSLFSLLFGIGFCLQLAGAERRGDVGLRRFQRRLLVLLGIGAIHMYFWEGDILFFYALVGFLLIPLRRLSGAALLRTSAALVLAPVALQAIIVVSHGRLDPGAPLLRLAQAVQAATGFPPDAAPFPTLRDAGWYDYLRFQLSGPFYRYADLLSSGRIFKVLAMFLLGLWVGRSGLLSDSASWVPVLRRVRFWGFAVGIPAAGLQAAMLLAGTPPLSWQTVLESIGYALGVAPLALAYASSFALLWQSERWRSRLLVLAPAGRMALTNYLSQTAFSIALFFGVGLGYMGRIGPTLWPPLVVAVLTAQVIFSRWWLSRYQFGPMEWLWRQATYGRRLPLRRTTAGDVPAQ